MAEAINQPRHHDIDHRPRRVSAHRPQVTHGPKSSLTEGVRPNYALRRLVAIGMLGLAAFGTKAVVADTLDRYNGTDIPSAIEAHEHPEQYAKYTVKEGDTRDGIALRYTSDNHDYRNNSFQIKDQMDAVGDPMLSAGDVIIVPTTTTPTETQPPKENG